MVLVGGALLTSGAIDLFFSYQDLRHALSNVERQRAVSAAVMIERFINEIEQQIQDAAKSPQPLSSAGLSQRRVNYASLLKHIPAVTDIFYIDAAGKEQLRVYRILADSIGSQAEYSGAADFLHAKAQYTYFSSI